MEDPQPQDEHSHRLLRQYQKLPPTPPESASDASESRTPGSVKKFPLPPPSRAPQDVLDIDKKTPDSHVPRDPRLIRLTGTHPLNVEAPLSALFSEGFLTTPELFYVRNHGAVPEVHDTHVMDWTFSIEGLVEKPMQMTLRQLLEEYDQVTYPVTLVCAGNRRKEQNVVRKSKGFSWGAAGVSTALFTGVSFSDILQTAKPKRNAKYVCMEGADELPNGYYGTSVKLHWAMDVNKGMMLAHKMNGELLRPDHGKPLRAVIPGQIGGRSVKWLKKIVLTAEPSDNWYHIYDNRVLPTMVSPEESSRNPKWWKDERYAIYDLSTNSAIAHPAHDERIALDDEDANYLIQGYAYTGGGRRISRVEISLDQGRSWQLADIDYPEDQYRQADEELFGGRLDMYWRETCFCWCFWKLAVRVADLLRSKDILVRAMDDSMNLQPRDMYWSVLGMMNNAWFRIAILREGGTLRFEHPTQPALLPGGWMSRIKESGGNLTNGHWGERIGVEEERVEPEKTEEIVMIKENLRKDITLDELRKHSNDADPWFVINGEVYNGTGFLKEHPGGAQSIISSAGLDASDEFMAIHSETAKSMMPQYHVGSLDAASRSALADNNVEDPAVDDEPRPTFLNPRTWLPALLVSKVAISSDTRIFTFALQSNSQTLGLPVGQHLMMRLKHGRDGESIIRAYTPISAITRRGYVDVLVKIYSANGPGWRGGKMTVAMDAMEVNVSTMDFKGPIGKFTYLGQGRCALNGVERHVKRFYMICAGSGITPIYQVFRAVMQDAKDLTHCTILNGNRKVEDILCKEDLDSLMSGNEEKGKIIYTLTDATESWSGLRGRVCREMVEQHFPKSQDTMFLICGPEALEKSVKTTLTDLGWADDTMVFF